MYTDRNFKTKKDLIAAVRSGKRITVYQPGGLFTSQKSGRVTIEGPHYPELHRWYASAVIKSGVIVSVK